MEPVTRAEIIEEIDSIAEETVRAWIESKPATVVFYGGVIDGRPWPAEKLDCDGCGEVFVSGNNNGQRPQWRVCPECDEQAVIAVDFKPGRYRCCDFSDRVPPRPNPKGCGKWFTAKELYGDDCPPVGDDIYDISGVEKLLRVVGWTPKPPYKCPECKGK